MVVTLNETATPAPRTNAPDTDAERIAFWEAAALRLDWEDAPGGSSSTEKPWHTAHRRVPADVEAGTVVIDLNFAYNPSCAYDPAWACPLAQPGNVLGVPVPVGELYG